MNIQDYNLQFPVYRTYECKLNQEGDDGLLYVFDLPKIIKEKQNVKAIISCTSEEKLSFTSEKIIAELKKSSGLIQNVTLVFNVKKSMHVRSKDIAKVKTAREKLQEYSRINDMECPEDLLDTVKEIEDSLDIKYTAPSHTLTLLKLKLRGAIGIKEGLNKEEYELDLTKYSQGVIALCAECGKGKTTIIENCHPYLKMLTRNGTLKDHFYLKDSYRELLYSDENNLYYLIRILINGSSKAGKVVTSVYRSTDIESLYAPDALENPAVEDVLKDYESYDDWVETYFGSIELFLRTAFYTKGNTGSVPDISLCTKGQKKAFFSSLLGTEKLTSISQSAKDKVKSLQIEVDKKSVLVKDIDFEEEILISNNKLSELKAEKARQEYLAAKANKAYADFIANNVAKDYDFRISETEARLEGLNSKYNELKSMKSVIEKWESAKDSYNDYTVNKKKLESLNERFNILSSENDKSLKEYMKLKDKASELEKIFLRKNDRFEHTFCGIATKIEDACPTCGQKLPPEKIAGLQKELNLLLEQKEIEERKVRDACNELGKAEFDVSKYKENILDKIQSEIKELSDTVKAIKDYLEEKYSNVDFESLKVKYDIYSEEYSEEKANSILAEIKKSEETLNVLNKEKSSFAASAVESEKKRLANELQELTDKVNSMNVTEGLILQELSQLSREWEQNKEVLQEIKKINHKIYLYATIERAFGSNGIQALELEALAPDVADITNSILYSVYGDKFKIAFQTLKKGSKNDLIEDFSIIIENTQTGSYKPLEWLSGGEGTWIKEALYHAFSIVRTESQQSTIRTRFLDEADGALDHDSKLKYLKMIETAGKEGGVDKTILITHSQELKDIIEQRIEL